MDSKVVTYLIQEVMKQVGTQTQSGQQGSGSSTRGDTSISLVTSLLMEHGKQLFEMMSEGIERSSPLSQSKGSATGGAKVDFAGLAESLSRRALAYSNSEERKKMKELINNIDIERLSDELGTSISSIMSKEREPEERLVVIVFLCVDVGARLMQSHLQPYWDVLQACHKVVQMTGLLSSAGPCDGDWEGTSV